MNLVTVAYIHSTTAQSLAHFVSKIGESHSWNNHTSAKKAAGLAINGDNEAVVVIENMIGEFTIETNQWEDVASVAGCYPCVPEAINGEPECMRDTVQCESACAPMTVVVDLTCSSSISSEDLQKRGAAILAAVMVLSSQRPLTLTIMSVSYHKQGSKAILVNIPTSPIDIATAAYMLTDPGFYRQIMQGYLIEVFKCPDGLPFPKYPGVPQHNTRTAEYKSAVMDFLSVTDGEENILYIPGTVSEDSIVENPKQWINDILALYSTN